MCSVTVTTWAQEDKIRKEKNPWIVAFYLKAVLEGVIGSLSRARPGTDSREGSQAAEKVHLSMDLHEWTISVGNTDPFFSRNLSEKTSEKKISGTCTTPKETGLRQSKAVVQGLLSKGIERICPLVWAAIRSRWHSRGALHAPESNRLQVLLKQFPSRVFETDTAMPNVVLEWDPGPTRKAAVSKSDCLNRLSSSQPHPVIGAWSHLMSLMLWVAWPTLPAPNRLYPQIFFLPWGLLPSTVNSLIYYCKRETELPVDTRRK